MPEVQKRSAYAKAGILFFLLTVVIYCLFGFVLTPEFTKITAGGKLLDIQTGYSGEAAVEQVAAYGEEGRAYYGIIQQVDIIFPIVYSLAFVFVVLFLVEILGNENRSLKLLVIPAILAAVFDLSENASIYILLSKYPESPVRAGTFASVFGIVKFGSIVLEMVIVGTLAVMAIVKFLRSKKKA